MIHVSEKSLNFSLIENKMEKIISEFQYGAQLSNTIPIILIAEDEALVALDIRRAVTKFGYNVGAISSTGESIIKKAEKEKPDLILMDIWLKGNINGIEAAKFIKNKYNIPIIFITASTDSYTHKLAEGTHPEGIIIKPFIESELKDTIDRALSHGLN